MSAKRRQVRLIAYAFLILGVGATVADLSFLGPLALGYGGGIWITVTDGELSGGHSE